MQAVVDAKVAGDVEDARAAVEDAAATIESMRSEMVATSQQELHTRMLLRCAIYDLELRYKRLLRLLTTLAPSPPSILPQRLAEFHAGRELFVQAAHRHRLDIAAARAIDRGEQANGHPGAYDATAPWRAPPGE